MTVTLFSRSFYQIQLLLVTKWLLFSGVSPFVISPLRKTLRLIHNHSLEFLSTRISFNDHHIKCAKVLSSSNQDEDTYDDHLVNVKFKTSAGTKIIKIPRGEILRTGMLKKGISPHNGNSRLINCRGLGTCGTCAVEVTNSDGCENDDPMIHPNVKNARETMRLNFPPHGSPDQSVNLRLACQLQVLGDVTVRKKSGFWGQDSKDLADDYDAKLYFGNLEFILDNKSPSKSK
jgi:ferredoxin